ncbi:hypothetical protein WME94_11190 [Sorangium sp. So ce429]
MNRQTKREMRQSVQRVSALLSVSIASAMHAMSCTSTDPCDYASRHACMGEEPVRPACLPIEVDTGPDSSCGVFVALAPRGKTGAAGTKDAPLASIHEAIRRAQEKATHIVYVCSGDFEETIEINGSVIIFGSLDCEDGWKWGKEGKATVLSASPGQVPLTMHPGEGLIRVEDIKVLAPEGNPSTDDASSIAAIADGGKVEFIRCQFETANAAKGADGADRGSPMPVNAPTGTAGSAGNSACSDNAVGTEEPASNECGTPTDTNDDSIGGIGGPGLPTQVIAGNPGDPDRATEPNGITNPNGGTRGNDGGCSPEANMTGAPGISMTGAPGISGGPGYNASEKADDFGTVSSTGYTGVSGTDGGRGTTAQGGGGGAGAKGGTPSCTAPNTGGASGGNGGSGGCGGLGGKGGLFGGSSIALISLDATISFENVTLKAGDGGDGGDGAPGQFGGEGGDGGDGGMAVGTLSPGCKGGKGGKGGDGGHGGGGLGGHSLGIAFVGKEPPVAGRKITIGGAGLGGTGPDDTKARGGHAAETLPFTNTNSQ